MTDYNNGVTRKVFGDIVAYFNKISLLHNEDGPAWNSSLSKTWYNNGRKHRKDGPAVEWWDGSLEWWYNGHHIPCKTQEEFERLLQLDLFW